MAPVGPELTTTGPAVSLPSTAAVRTATPPPPVPAPAPRGGTLREGLGRMWREKPLETAGVVGSLLVGIPTVLAALGYLTLRAREFLIGLDEPLDYPKPLWIANGADALWSLPRRGLLALSAEYPTVRFSAWALLLLLLTFLGVRFLRWRHNTVRLTLLSLAAVLLLYGGQFYAVAIRSKPPCSELTSPAETAAFETCSWLANRGERNTQRRQDLAGLLAWFLAAGGVAAWIAARSPRIAHPWAGRLRWTLLAWHLGLLVFLFLPLLPRAYAVAEWGAQYPAVKLRRGDPACKPDLAEALAQPGCCAVDISAGADDKYLYVLGLGCRQHGIVPLKTPSTNGSECIESRSTGSASQRVIYDEC